MPDNTDNPRDEPPVESDSEQPADDQYEPIGNADGDDWPDDVGSTVEDDGQAGTVTAVNSRLAEFLSDARSLVGPRGRALASLDYASGLKLAAFCVVLAPLAVLSPLVNALPKTWKVYHKLHTWSAWQMQKAASADALANIRRSNGREDVRPAAWVESAEDEKDRTGWKVKGLGDKRYDPAVHGRSASRLGKADLIHINEDDPEQGTWTEATLDNAFQLDRERYLFRDAIVEVENLVYDAASAGGGGSGRGEGAVADGGQVKPDKRVQTTDVSLAKPGILEDILVPIGSRAGYDGQMVSFGQFSEVKNQQSDQEAIRDAKNSAWAAAKLDDIGGADLLKWAIILGIGGALLLFHQDIGAFISGLSNSGGGGGGVGPGGLG